MNTSTEAIKMLQRALKTTRDAQQVIDNLIAAHDYQDVASLVTQAAAATLEAATLLMQGQDGAALDKLERADDLLESMYEIIGGDMDEGN